MTPFRQISYVNNYTHTYIYVFIYIYIYVYMRIYVVYAFVSVLILTFIHVFELILALILKRHLFTGYVYTYLHKIMNLEIYSQSIISRKRSSDDHGLRLFRRTWLISSSHMAKAVAKMDT